MPKQIFEINRFSSGIIANPKDELDIPIDAATLSLNIDPLGSGQLQGIPNVQVLKTGGFVNEFRSIQYTRPFSSWSSVASPSVQPEPNAPSGS